MSKWINFKKLRSELNFETVLSAYGVTLRIKETAKGRQHVGPCPLSKCGNVPSKRKTFSANIAQGIWQCFGCHQKGNALDFIALMEGLDISNGADVRKAALIAQKKFLDKEEPQAQLPLEAKVGEETESKVLRTVVNAPLDFELKSLDPNHPWFEEQGLSKETVKHFGLGYCSKGWLKGRIAIPLHDAEGRLVGYAGRLLKDEEATNENPLYIFPQSRIHGCTRHIFELGQCSYRNSKFNLSVDRSRIGREIEITWFLWQRGYSNVIAYIQQ